VSADLLTLWALLSAGVLAMLVFIATHRLYFGLVAPALLYLSTDELVDIHERLGRWLDRHEVDAPGLQDADSLVLLGYGVVLTILTVRFRTQLTGAPWAGKAFLAAFVLGALAVMMDAVVPRTAFGSHGEEYLEAGAALSLAAVFLAHAVAVIRGWGSLSPASVSGAPGDVVVVVDDAARRHALEHEGTQPGGTPG
jgi:hypothetical protein